MGDNQDKRHRALNFSETEANLLISLVEKYKHIVENKKTDAVSRKDKDKAWTKISMEFSALSQIHRSLIELKNKYENIKRQLKKKITDNRNEILKTGGGTANIKELSHSEETLKSILAISIDGLKNSVDSDYYESSPLVEQNEESSNEEVEETIEFVIENHDDPTGPVLQKNHNESLAGPSWQEWTPTLLKTRKAKDLQLSVGKSQKLSTGETNVKFANLAEAKLELVKLQVEFLKNQEKRRQENDILQREKLELEIKYMREKEELDIEAKKIQISLLKKQLK